MKKIERHQAVIIPGAVEREMTFLKQARFPDDAEPESLDSLLQSALLAVAHASLSANSVDDLKMALRAASRAAAGLFAIETGHGIKASVTWIDESFWDVPTKDPTDLSGPLYWRYGFYCALAARDDRALEKLSQASIDKIRHSISADECAFLHIEALQAYWHRDPQAPQKLLEALRATDPDLIHPAAVDYTLHILVPEMELLYQLMLKNHQGFTTALEKSLLSQRAYYSKGQAIHDIFGQIAWGPLGLCCHAHDANWSIQIESGYIPASVIFS